MGNLKNYSSVTPCRIVVGCGVFLAILTFWAFFDWKPGVPESLQLPSELMGNIPSKEFQKEMIRLAEALEKRGDSEGTVKEFIDLCGATDEVMTFQENWIFEEVYHRKRLEYEEALIGLCDATSVGGVEMILKEPALANQIDKVARKFITEAPTRGDFESTGMALRDVVSMAIVSLVDKSPRDQALLRVLAKLDGAPLLSFLENSIKREIEQENTSPFSRGMLDYLVGSSSVISRRITLDEMGSRLEVKLNVLLFKPGLSHSIDQEFAIETIANLSRFMSDHQWPVRESVSDIGRSSRRYFTLNPGGYWEKSRSDPNGDSVLYASLHSDSLRTLALTLVALCRYEHDYGSLPESLSALVPNYLSSLPKSFYDGQLLSYDSRKRLLWSPGEFLMRSPSSPYDPKNMSRDPFSGERDFRTLTIPTITND